MSTGRRRTSRRKQARKEVLRPGSGKISGRRSVRRCRRTASGARNRSGRRSPRCRRKRIPRRRRRCSALRWGPFRTRTRCNETFPAGRNRKRHGVRPRSPSSRSRLRPCRWEKRPFRKRRSGSRRSAPARRHRRRPARSRPSPPRSRAKSPRRRLYGTAVTRASPSSDHTVPHSDPRAGRGRAMDRHGNVGDSSVAVAVAAEASVTRRWTYTVGGYTKRKVAACTPLGKETS